MLNKPIGVILAGGKGTRMGGQDKGLMDVNGHKLVELTIKAVQSQVINIIISANRNNSDYQRFSNHVVTDISSQYNGPLAGIFSVMEYLGTSARYRGKDPDLLVIPCDMPLLPPDLTARLYKTRRDSGGHQQAVIVDDGDRLQPLCCLLPLALKPRLKAFLDNGNRKVTCWLKTIDVLTANFSDEKSHFVNINSREDLSQLASKVRSDD